MVSKRAEIYSLIALILAAGALAFSLAPPPAARAARTLQEAPADDGAPVTAAAVNALARTFNYQGVLRLPDGSLAEGVFDMTFAIYVQVSGGTALHSETITGVAVRNGIFSVVLGATEATPIGPNVFASTPRYLGIAVGADPEMLPRQRIHPVPWALMAETLPAGATTQGRLDVAGDLFALQGVKSQNSIFTMNDLVARNSNDQPEVFVGGTAVSLGWSEADNQARLRVSGDGPGATNGLDIQVPGRSLMRLTHNGNIGIGTTSPTAKLDVHGDFKVNGVAPIRIIRFRNIGNDAVVNTGVAEADYDCVATGWSANYDILETGARTNMVWTYTEGGTWRLRVSLASHGDHPDDPEDPDVDVVCFHRGIVSWEGRNGATRGLNEPN